MKKVCIIGAGLSGLSCAHYLQNKNYEVKIFEKSNFAGGRVNSEKIRGYTCDVGFQVLLNNYKEVNSLNIYKKLKMKYFNSGAEIYFNKKRYEVYNPLYHPIKFLASDFLKVFTMRDIYKLIVFILFNRVSNKKTGPYIKKLFSNKLVKLFFYPFFKGVFLSENLDNDISFFKKLLIKFSMGRAGLPAEGMMQLPKEIIKNSNLKINFNKHLKKIKNKQAFFEDGTCEKFDKIVSALPLSEINKITKNQVTIKYNSNITTYFASSKKVMGKSLFLVPEKQYKINSIQCLSNVCSGFSKKKKHLYSVSSLDFEATEKELKLEFQKITKIPIADIETIKTYKIKKALPRQTVQIKDSSCIYFCGDWNTEPSIDGAIKSGRKVAEKL